MGIRNGRTCQTGDETHKEDTFMKTPGRHRIVVAAIIAAPNAHAARRQHGIGKRPVVDFNQVDSIAQAATQGGLCV